MPIISASTPSDCFEVAYEAIRIAVQHMTPVILLSDGYIANGAEPWKFPIAADLPESSSNSKLHWVMEKNNFNPICVMRSWFVPGPSPAPLAWNTGSVALEKQNITGNVSYEPENHQLMIKIRKEKIDKIADYIPLQKIDSGPEKGKLLVLGWGSTYGAIKSAVAELQHEGYAVAHAHLRYVRPFPKNLGDILKNYEQVLIPEINDGQLDQDHSGPILRRRKTYTIKSWAFPSPKRKW